MTLVFNSPFLPRNEGHELFGFVQKSYKPENQGEFDSVLGKCKICACRLFPCKNGSTACPICTPDADFRSEAFKIDSGLDNRSLFFLIVDLAFSFQKIDLLTSSFAKEIDDSDSVVIMAVSGDRLIIVCAENGVPYFTLIDNAANFEATNLYESSKEELVNDILPSLVTLHSLFSRTESGPVDIIKPIQVAVRQAEKEKFAIFFFLASETKPITVEMAGAAGKSVYASGGIIHFAATSHFKRLSAICRASLGCVFGIAEFVPSLIHRLLNASRSLAMKLIFPRYVEVEKVTGCDGSLRVTASLTIIKCRRVMGWSGRLTVDVTSASTPANQINFVEISNGVEGKFIALHRFTVAETVARFSESLANEVSRNLVLKGWASDVMRAAWAGGQWSAAIGKFLKNKQIQDILKASCLCDLGERDDRDALRVYYILGCFCSDLKNEIVKIGRGSVFLSPPIAFVYFEESPCDLTAVDQLIAGDWPFEFRLFGDVNAFRSVVEKLGGKLQ